MSVETGQAAQKKKHKSKRHQEATETSSQKNLNEPNFTSAEEHGAKTEGEGEVKEPVKKKEKRKKRKTRDEEEGSEKGFGGDGVEKEGKARKRDTKKKRVADEILKTKGTEGVGQSETEKKVKKKRKEQSNEGAEANNATVADEAGNKEKKKKRTKLSEHIQGAALEETVIQPESSKKSKNKRKKEASDTQNERPGEHAESVRKKKKRKTGQHGFPDPDADESLTDQARKALSYAFTHSEDLSSWKFNKAKQNWLIRNLWSEEAIPDSYIALTTHYLSRVQGGARDTLIKTCREVASTNLAEAPSSEGDAAATETAPVSAPTPTHNATQIQRAKDLLAAVSIES